LSLIAGYVDAITFLGLFGFFVAQVTGSFVFLGAATVTGGAHELSQLLAVPVFFLSGVLATLLAGAALAAGRRPLVWTMFAECVLLAAMAASSLLGAPFAQAGQPWAAATALLGLATMGVQTAQVRLLMRGAPSTNVMTANTGQLAADLGQLIIAWWAGRGATAAAPPDWLPAIRRRLVGTATVMAGFFCGTVAGALLFAAGKFLALLLPLAALIALWLWTLATVSRPART
jgi:uncharacterized membrane protein YoaK (UPF0700 family)